MFTCWLMVQCKMRRTSRHWNPEKSEEPTSLLTSHTFIEMPQNLYRDPNIQPRCAIQTLSRSDVNSGRKSQEPAVTVFSMQTCLQTCNQYFCDFTSYVSVMRQLLVFTLIRKNWKCGWFLFGCFCCCFGFFSLVFQPSFQLCEISRLFPLNVQV